VSAAATPAVKREMTTIVVGVADCRTSAEPGSTIATYALGSCIAVAVHDPVARVGGLLHFMLPESNLDRAKAEQNPSMFADTGIPLLLSQIGVQGACRKRLVVQLAGGAQMMDGEGVFNIGKRNLLAARKILWQSGMIVRCEAVGGIVSRTVKLEVATGRFWLREAGSPERELLPQRAAGKEGGNGLQRFDRG
jgi:chemotaxis protein CheD